MLHCALNRPQPWTAGDDFQQTADFLSPTVADCMSLTVCSCRRFHASRLCICIICAIEKWPKISAEKQGTHHIIGCNCKIFKWCFYVDFFFMVTRYLLFVCCFYFVLWMLYKWCSICDEFALEFGIRCNKQCGRRVRPTWYAPARL